MKPRPKNIKRKWRNRCSLLPFKKTPDIGQLSTRERIEWIDRHLKTVGTIKKGCEVMKLSMSTYYADSQISRAEKEEEDANIRDKIEHVRVQFPRTGYRMILHHLQRQGVEIGETKLRRIIDKFNLHFKPKKKFIRTTDSNHNFEIHPNLIEEFTVNNINQVWTGDITYIRIENGFVYLAVIMDLFSREVIGWQISKKIDSHIALDALKMLWYVENIRKVSFTIPIVGYNICAMITPRF